MLGVWNCVRFCACAKGLSIPAGLLELACYAATSSYSFYHKFPFSTYGDATFLAAQTTVISFLTISWEISYLCGMIFLSFCACFAAYAMSPAINLSFLILMQMANTPVILFSRVSFTKHNRIINLQNFPSLGTSDFCKLSQWQHWTAIGDFRLANDRWLTCSYLHFSPGDW
uniref:Mannose-P-dolichol utilization defect 1 protein homolog n=1 Tax=Mesocestoides corti TaxID=53468 RepID=A0A5K3ER72_MESCO